MGKIFCILGKSSTGKDTVYRRILNDPDLNLNSVVSYTTRPIRDGEKQGETYHFVSEDDFWRLKSEGKIIEDRAYRTVHGLWRYFTVNDRKLDPEHRDYLMIGVLNSYLSIRDFFGKDRVVPIYIEVDDGVRLQRALDREKKPENRKFAELCRRFLADSEDFAEEKLLAAGLTTRFANDDLDLCVDRIKAYIQEKLSGREGL